MAVGLIGADYGTVDADENDKWDGLSLYTYQENDPGGTWRAIFMASDNGGVSSPEWRTHTPLRMLTANAGKKPKFCVLGCGDIWQKQQATSAQGLIAGTGDFEEDVPSTPVQDSPFTVNLALYVDQVVYLTGHGSNYEQEGTYHHDGDRVTTHQNKGVATTTAVARRYDMNNAGSETYAVVRDGTQYWLGQDDDAVRYELREGLPWKNNKRRCRFLAVAACDSAKTQESFARRLEAGKAAICVLGYTRKMNEALNIVFMRKFWEEFAEEDWSRPGWWDKLGRAHTDALESFWSEYPDPLNGTDLGLFLLCDPQIWSHGDTFTYMTEMPTQ